MPLAGRTAKKFHSILRNIMSARCHIEASGYFHRHSLQFSFSLSLISCASFGNMAPLIILTLLIMIGKWQSGLFKGYCVFTFHHPHENHYEHCALGLIASSIDHRWFYLPNNLLVCVGSTSRVAFWTVRECAKFTCIVGETNGFNEAFIHFCHNCHAWWIDWHSFAMEGCFSDDRGRTCAGIKLGWTELQVGTFSGIQNWFQ